MLKMQIKRFTILIVSAVLLSQLTAYHTSGAGAEEISAEGFGAESVFICEAESGQVLYERNAEDKRPMGHMAKLMTILICAEELKKGSISLTDEVTTSAYANSMPSPQIWLEQGDRITVEELLKSITIGNANDACVALCEKLSGSLKAHTERMNRKASDMGMKDTHFEDCNGLDKNTVSTAKDLYILSKAVVKFDDITRYFTTWIDKVKRQAIELVNVNKLIRLYKGTVGLKACTGFNKGFDLICTVKRQEMTICLIALGANSKDELFSAASKTLDKLFDNFRIYKPEPEEELLKEITVISGRKQSVPVETGDKAGVLLRKGQSSKAEYKADIPETVEAPVKKGEQLGKIVYSLDGKEIAEVKICAAEDVERMDILYGIYKCLCNLCNL